ncbi:MAG: hypothetical protein R2698_05780 [Microthrixaceae bacterium]
MQFLTRLARRRFVAQATFDGVAWVLSMLVAALLRSDFAYDSRLARWSLTAGVVAALLHVAIGRALGLYIHRWRYGTFEELAAATVSCILASFATTGVILVSHSQSKVPTSVPLLAGPIACCALFLARSFWRIMLDRSSRPDRERAERVLVFGAGDGGRQVVTAMLTTPGSPYVPVGMLDDNPDLKNLRVKSVPVLGGRNRLKAVAERKNATTVVIAIPSASSELIREIVSLTDEIGLSTLVLPPVSELFGSVRLHDIRELTEADLLGRREVNTDVESVAGYLTGRRVLVTGAGDRSAANCVDRSPGTRRRRS